MKGLRSDLLIACLFVFSHDMLPRIPIDLFSRVKWYLSISSTAVSQSVKLQECRCADQLELSWVFNALGGTLRLLLPA